MGTAPASSFVGREAEVRDLGLLVEQRPVVTIVGEGGVGKTRLARELTAAGAGGSETHWVDLGSATEPGGVRSSFEDALTPTGRGARFEDLLDDRLPAGTSLLVLDNCEHVLDDIAERVAAIRSVRPAARILATSRARLDVNDEVVFRLMPLKIPAPDAGLDQVGDAPAVALLIDRLGDVVTGFELDAANVAHLGEIAVRTEGVPLAIELVAAAAASLPLSEIAHAVPDLRALGVVDTRRTPRRHRSLDASVRWSVDRLGPAAGVAFRRLGAFADSFSFSSAIRVISDGCDRDDRVAAGSFKELVEASLVRRLDDERFGFPMAVRTYAQDELEADPAASDVRDRHSLVIHDVVAAAAGQLRAGTGTDERWLCVLDRELPEVRASINWHLERGRPDRAAALLCETYDHAHMRGRYGEFLAQSRHILTDPALPRPDAAHLSAVAAIASLMAGRVLDGYGFAVRALTDAADPVSTGRAHLQRAWTGFMAGRLDAATMWADLDEGRRLAQELDDGELRAMAHIRYGSLTVHAGTISGGRQALADARRSGDLHVAHHHLAARLFALYGVAVFGLDLDTLMSESVALISDCRATGHVAYQSMALATAGTIAALRNDPDLADALLDEAATLTRRHELTTFQNLVQRWRAFAEYRFDRSGAVTHAERALALAEETTNAWDEAAAHALLGVLHLDSDHARARRHAERALEMSTTSYYPSTYARAQLALALVDLGDDSFGRGLDRVHDALQRAEDFGDVLAVAHSLDHLARFEAERHAFERSARFIGAADALHERAGVPRLPCERQLRDDVERSLLRQLGRAEAERLIAVGRSLDRGGAVRLARRSRGRRRRPVSGWSSLTPTELDVASLAADGLTNAAIADRLVMSPNTVKTHLSHVYAKIGVTGRSALAAVWASRSRPT